jgi:ferredoxin-NADP reductase
MGDFVLPIDHTIPLVFVAGGIGLTPFHSMLEWLADTGQVRDIKFIYAVRNENEIIFQDTFKKAAQHVTIIVSEPSEEWGGERGRVTAESIIGLTQPPENALIYVSGPEPMVIGLAKDLVAQGIEKSQVVSDEFPGYTGP